MTTDLVEKLKTSSEKQRKSVAMELAKIGTNEAVRELKRTVEGSRRKGLRWYNIDDAITGIEALGETKRLDALEFLKYIYTPKISEKSKTGVHDYMEGVERWVEIYTYPHASYELAEVLKHEIEKDSAPAISTTSTVSSPTHYGDPDGYPESDIPTPIIEDGKPKLSDHARAHNAFRSAISKLEASTKKT